MTLDRPATQASRRKAPGVVDEGISGNRLFNGSRCPGDGDEVRFERDALSQPVGLASAAVPGIG